VFNQYRGNLIVTSFEINKVVGWKNVYAFIGVHRRDLRNGGDGGTVFPLFS